MKDEGRLERGATAAPGPQRLRDACQAMRACVALPDAHTHTHTCASPELTPDVGPWPLSPGQRTVTPVCCLTLTLWRQRPGQRH